MSETRYHVNSVTGRVGRCKAEIQCRFNLSEEEHASSPEEALRLYEQSRSEDQKTVLKGLRSKKTDAKNDFFKGGTIRTTEYSEAGTQILVVADALGVVDLDSVKSKYDLVDVFSRLPSTTKNYSDLQAFCRRVLNDDGGDEVVSSALRLARACRKVFEDAGLSNDQVAKNLRWMGREPTQGRDSSVGDVGVDLEDGRKFHVSLKVLSPVLHNGTQNQVLTESGIPITDLYEQDETVRSIDQRAFSRAVERFVDDLKDGVLEVGGQRWETIVDENRRKWIRYSTQKNSKVLVVARDTLVSLDAWKTNSLSSSKVLGFYISARSEELIEDDVYPDVVRERSRAVSKRLSDEINADDQVRRVFASKMLGLRRERSYYINDRGERNGVVNGVIPSVDDFLSDNDLYVGKATPDANGVAIRVPVYRRSTGMTAVLKVRARFADGQFNYKSLKLTGEDMGRRQDVGSKQATVAEIVFGARKQKL